MLFRNLYGGTCTRWFKETHNETPFVKYSKMRISVMAQIDAYRDLGIQDCFIIVRDPEGFRTEYDGKCFIKRSGNGYDIIVKTVKHYRDRSKETITFNNVKIHLKYKRLHEMVFGDIIWMSTKDEKDKDTYCIHTV